MTRRWLIILALFGIIALQGCSTTRMESATTASRCAYNGDCYGNSEWELRTTYDKEKSEFLNDWWKCMSKAYEREVINRLMDKSASDDAYKNTITTFASHPNPTCQALLQNFIQKRGAKFEQLLPIMKAQDEAANEAYDAKRKAQKIMDKNPPYIPKPYLIIPDSFKF